MIAALKSYPEMKDSDVEWLGEVPEHWEVLRLRNAVAMRVSNVDKHVKEGEEPVRLCNYVDVYKNDHINQRINFMRATATPGEIKRFRLEEEDVLITKDSEAWNDIGVPALVTEPADDLISGYHLALLRPFVDKLTGSFLLRALQSKGLAYQFHVEARGVTRYGLSHTGIKAVWIPLPPLPEQDVIVRYLDHVDRRVRRLVRAKRKLIALLTEQKQAIIHRAVTRGLNPDVPCRESGVEWLGDVPEHWEVLRTKYVFREVDQRSTTGEETHLSMSQTLGLVPSELVQSSLTSESYIGGKLCEPDDMVLNRLKAHLGVFALANQAGVISPDYSVFRRRRGTNTRYYERVLRSPACRRELRIRAKGIVEGFWRLYTDDFYDIRVPVPPVPEQDLIVAHCNRITADIDNAISRTHHEIDLLIEYRTRLIADVVTGKLDVGEAAAALHEVDPLVDDELDSHDRVAEADIDDLDVIPEEAEA